MIASPSSSLWLFVLATGKDTREITAFYFDDQHIPDHYKPFLHALFAITFFCPFFNELLCPLLHPHGSLEELSLKVPPKVFQPYTEHIYFRSFSDTHSQNKGAFWQYEMYYQTIQIPFTKGNYSFISRWSRLVDEHLCHFER